MRHRTQVVAALLAAACSTAAVAQDGTLDPTFGQGGARRIGFDLPGSNLGDWPAAVAVQPDGKAVIVGSADHGNLNRDLVVARLTADGTLDGGFGAGGMVDFAFSSDEVASGVVVEPDGSILLASTADSVPPSAADVVLRRLDAAGGSPSGVGIPVGGTLFFDRRVGLARDPASGKIYVAFSREFDNSWAVRVERLNADFTSDFSYGNAGVLEFALPLQVSGSVARVEVLADGRQLIAGFDLGVGHDFYVARATSSGFLDSGFGTQGIATVPVDLVSNGVDLLESMAVDGHGRILLAGNAEAGASETAAVLVRLTPSGALDPSFNNGAPLVLADTAGDDSANGVVVQSDGRIVVAGKVQGAASPMFWAVRLLEDGSPDWSFGSFGEFAANFPNSPNDDYAVALALDGGRAVLVGPAEWSAPDYDFGVMRLTSALIFTDGFERGSAGAWSAVAP